MDKTVSNGQPFASAFSERIRNNTNEVIWNNDYELIIK
jgi:hypothetical protein